MTFALSCSKDRQQTFLDRIITCDETWVLYDNREAEKQWLPKGQPAQATPKRMWPKKQMACVWWGVTGIHWELLPINTINAEVYQQQLQRVYDRLRRPSHMVLSRSGIILQQDGAAPHRAQTTREKIERVGWELLPHPPHSPDLEPSDYHLFRPLKYYMLGKQFNSGVDLENVIRDFLDSRRRMVQKRDRKDAEIMGKDY